MIDARCLRILRRCVQKHDAGSGRVRIESNDGNPALHIRDPTASEIAPGPRVIVRAKSKERKKKKKTNEKSRSLWREKFVREESTFPKFLIARRRFPFSPRVSRSRSSLHHVVNMRASPPRTARGNKSFLCENRSCNYAQGSHARCTCIVRCYFPFPFNSHAAWWTPLPQRPPLPSHHHHDTPDNSIWWKYFRATFPLDKQSFTLRHW